MVAIASTAPQLGRFVTIWLHNAPDWHCSGLVVRIVRCKGRIAYQLRDWKDGKLRPLIMAYWIRRTRLHPSTENPARTEAA